MNNLLSKIGFSIIAAFTAIGGLFSVPNAPDQIKTAIPSIVAVDPRIMKMQRDLDFIQTEVYKLQNQRTAKLGATNAADSIVALFEDSLASALAKTDTTMTLVSGNDINGTALASSTYGFIIDQGTSKQELVRADCTGTSCTGMVRGISIVDGTSTVAALQFTHRAGASVKITDAPILLQINRIIQGIGTFPNIVSYTSANTFTSGNQIITKTYADNLSFAGAPNASVSAKGIVQIATNTQTASSTATGSTGAILAIPASAATSTPGANVHVGSGNTYVVVTKDNGYIATTSIDTTSNYSWTGSHTFAGSFTATSTVTLPATTTINSLSYVWPATQSTVNGDVLKNNGNGILAWAQNATTTFLVPHPTCNASTTIDTSDTSNTTSQWGSFELPFTMTVNTIYFNVTAVGTSGSYSVGIYNTLGQKLASTTPTISATGLATDTVSPAVTLTPGVYYVGFIPVGGTSISTTRWSCAFDYFSTISGKNRFSGRRTESPASVLPSAPDFTALTQNNNDGLAIRLNN